PAWRRWPSSGRADAAPPRPHRWTRSPRPPGAGPWPPRWPRPAPTPRAPPTASGRRPRARHAFSASELSSLGTRRLPTRGTGEHVVLEVLVVVTTRSLLNHEPDDGGLFSLRLEHDRLHVRLL